MSQASQRLDDGPVRAITYRDYQPRGSSDLELWLQKEAATKLDSNEEDTTAVTVDVREEPSNAERDGTSHAAKSGEPPHILDASRHDPYHNNDATYDESEEGRQGVVERLFDSLSSARTADQQLLGANFNHAHSGDFTAHSLLLQGKTKEGSVQLSLLERVRKVTGTS